MVVNAVRKVPWFTYFPDNYRWSFIVSIGLMRVAGGGADTAEIFEVCRNLDRDVGNDDLWFDEWAGMGDRLRAMGMAALRRGHDLTAAGHFSVPPPITRWPIGSVSRGQGIAGRVPQIHRQLQALRPP